MRILQYNVYFENVAISNVCPFPLIFVNRLTGMISVRTLHFETRNIVVFPRLHQKVESKCTNKV